VELSDKIVVITGASKGLGKEIAIRLSKKQSKVILIARNKELLEHTQKEIQNLTGNMPFIVACDVSNEKDVNRMAKTIHENFQHIDVLINNAGIGIHKNSEKMANEEMRKQFEINFYGAFYCIKALLPLIKCSHSGYILNIGSLVSKVSFADNSVYAATKFALSGFTEGFRYEMKKSNIKVGIFLPGLMDTAFQDDREGSKAPAFLILKPSEVAKVVEKMICKRKKIVYMYRWMLIPMRVKQLFGY
jgi:hypothetical protein